MKEVYSEEKKIFVKAVEEPKPLPGKDIM